MYRNGLAKHFAQERTLGNSTVASWDRAALWLARSLVVSSLVYASWRFGAVQAESVRDLSVMLFAASFLLLARTATWRDRTPVPWVIPTLGVLFLAYGFFQTLPSGTIADTVGFARPDYAAGEIGMLDSAIQDLEQGKTYVSDSHGSIAPDETLQALVPISLACAICVLSSVAFRTRESRHLLVAALIGNAAFIAIWAIIQRSGGNRELLPGIEHAGSAVPFAGFVYKNAGAAFLVLPIAMASGYLFIHRKSIRTSEYQIPSRFTSASYLSLCAVAALLTAGLLITQSRGAWVAAIAAALAVAASGKHLKIGRAHWIAFATGVGCIIAVTLSSGGAKSVASNASRLTVEQVASDSRWEHWKDGWRTGIEHFPFGSGLGTYGFATLPNQSQTYSSWFRRAHNQYLETFVETGLPGTLLLIAGICWLGWMTLHLLLTAERTEHRRFALIAIVALVAGGLQSVFDFVLAVPANLMLYASVIGIISVVALECQAFRDRHRRESRPQLGVLQRLPAPAPKAMVALTVVAGLLCLWSLNTSRARVLGDLALEKSKVPELKAAPEEGQIACRLRLLDEAIEHQPLRASLHNRRAAWQLLAYRSQLVEAARAEQLDLPWSKTKRDVIYTAMVTMPRARREELRRSLLKTPELRAAAAQMLRDHQNALKSNPFAAQSHLRCVAISPLAGMPSHRWTRSMARLINNSHNMLYYNGCYAALSGDVGFATDQWAKSLSISHQHIEQIYRLARPRISASALATRLVPSRRPDIHLRLLQQTNSSEPDAVPKLASDIIGHVQADQQMLPSRRYATVAEVHEMMDHQAQAVAAWEFAVKSETRNIEYRWRYAEALRAVGMYDEALDQVALAQAMRPEDARFVRLASRIRKEIGQHAGH